MTDSTGVTSSALIPYTWAICDLADYVNTEEPIEGVELRVITYDTKYDPARDVPGYDWLRGRGAELIIAPLTASAEALKAFAERDKVPIIAAGGVSAPLIEPPGWVFCAPPPYSYTGMTLLKWISEQWPDYPTKPKLGVAGWNTASGQDRRNGPLWYCQNNPDKFEYVGDFMAPSGTMKWAVRWSN